ncbi:aminoglycoside 6-adenylyltransferase [Allokutzneria albata]|uniref:Aminoglycoside 6-adenylyltransferase n=1 Tax=Allokutzneria albata TaxID=211114 RepID=A0A1G9S4W8_ALLAB|nr:aminoglycoside 6-adenylyltransferase [Allokutzneria albata]SDM29785.1 aminoglycoside 6-adenylyltransferase [Allokutzneria albata]
MIFENGELVVPRLLDWVRARPDVRAVLRTGSRARGEADAWSDHDIELYSTDPEPYRRSDWPADLGPVLASVGLDGPWDNPARLVVFDGGQKIDFQIVPVDRLALLAEELDELHERGYEILLDLDGAAARLPAASGSGPEGELPDEQEFREHCEEFWFELAHIPRYVARGDLWVAKSRDWETKELLLTMVEWHALSHFGPDHDTWHNGIRMREWAAPGVWERMDALFTGFAPEDILHTASATGALFADLARDVAHRHGFTYPEAASRAFATE